MATTEKNEYNEIQKMSPRCGRHRNPDFSHMMKGKGQ